MNRSSQITGVDVHRTLVPSPRLDEVEETTDARVARHRLLAHLDNCLDVLELALANGVGTVDERMVAALRPDLPFLASGMTMRDAHARSLRYEGHFMRAGSLLN